MDKPINIDGALARRLVDEQFPQWRTLPIVPIKPGGWDNRSFRLGNSMLVRLPSAAPYAAAVDKEQAWLPKLAPLLPQPIPQPLAVGKPSQDYPWKWSIYKWLEGEPAATAEISDLTDLARSVGNFLFTLRHIDGAGGPQAGPHNFFRGGTLATYDADTRRAIATLQGKIDSESALAVWEAALATRWEHAPVWVHGDISAGNLLIRDGRLCGVIDFGQLAIGDPACDLAIAWTLFREASRKAFCAAVGLDEGTWARGRAWTLWKALVVAAGQTDPGNHESSQCWRIIDDVLSDHLSK